MKMNRRLKDAGLCLLKLAAILTTMLGMLWAASTCLECPDNTRKLIDNHGLRLLGAATMVAMGLVSHCAIAVLLED